MTEIRDIKGGAGEFEAAVIAVVIDQLAREEAQARQGRGVGRKGPGLSAWVRAMSQESPAASREKVWPE